MKTSIRHYEDTFACVQCGYCLPVCPTYQVLEKESASPRGRIALIKLAAEGKIDIVEHLAGPIDSCIGCRACETACPTSVPYGAILEGAKESIAERRQPSTWRGKKLRSFVLDKVLPSRSVLRAIVMLIWMYQVTGIRFLLHRTGFSKWGPFHFGEFDRLLPRLAAPWTLWKKRLQQSGQTLGHGRVAFFAGCVMDSLFVETNRKSTELLQMAGLDVVEPRHQTCCGALHTHAGELEAAKRLAKQNIAAFEASGADWYVNNAGGCGAMLVEYHQLLADDPEWKDRAARFSEKSIDIHAILSRFELPFDTEQPKSARITYQDSCHLRHVQGVHREPRQLLQSIPGAQYVELPGADSCCGSGGIYNLLQYDTSMKVLDPKMDQVASIASTASTQTTVLVTSNPGCLMQMRLGVQRAGMEDTVRVVHTVDILYESMKFKNEK